MIKNDSTFGKKIQDMEIDDFKKRKLIQKEPQKVKETYEVDPFKDVQPEDLVTGDLQVSKPNEELATFGAGCYWGTEKYLATKFLQLHPGSILGHSVGFMSPNENAPANPTYRQVCAGKTTHVEVLQLKFDNTIVSYEDIVRFFFTFHDPTTKDRQENDKGDRYGSVIFYHSPE